MKEHSNLAKNLLPNCAQGKATAIRLWDELALKLNAVGPPVKDAKMWRKVLKYIFKQSAKSKYLIFIFMPGLRRPKIPSEEKVIFQ